MSINSFTQSLATDDSFIHRIRGIDGAAALLHLRYDGKKDVVQAKPIATTTVIAIVFTWCAFTFY